MNLTPADQPLAFLSYSRADLVWVADLARELRRVGIRTWMDVENLSPGERWRDAMNRGLKEASIFVACISRYSLESKWTGVEAREAALGGVRILPIILDDTDTQVIPPILSKWQVAKLASSSAAQRTVEAARLIARSLGVLDARQAGPIEDPGRLLVVKISSQLVPASTMPSQGSYVIPGDPSSVDISNLIDQVSRAQRIRIVCDVGVSHELRGIVFGVACARVGIENVLVDQGWRQEC